MKGRVKRESEESLTRFFSFSNYVSSILSFKFGCKTIAMIANLGQLFTKIYVCIYLCNITIKM